jgi:hypothetical protein
MDRHLRGVNVEVTLTKIEPIDKARGKALGKMQGGNVVVKNPFIVSLPRPAEQCSHGGRCAA